MKEARSRAARLGFPNSFIFSAECPPIHKLAANGIDVVIDIEASESYYAGDYKSAADCQTRFANLYNFRGEPEIPGINMDVVLNGVTLAPVTRSDETKAEDVANLLDDLDQAIRDSTAEASQIKDMVSEVEDALGHKPADVPHYSDAENAALEEMMTDMTEALRHFSTVSAETDMVPALEEDRDTRI